MVVGHTKFSPDSHFGTMKSLLRNTKVQSIVDLTDEDGLIRKSAKNNFVIVYKDPVSLEKNWEWRDWKKFSPPKFNECVGIKDWHVVKIPSESHFIEVSKAVGQPSTLYRTMNGDLMLDENDRPKIIEPEAMSDDRLKQLEYFKQFVDDLHKPYISDQY